MGKKVKDHEGKNCSVWRSGRDWKPRETVSSLQLRKRTPPILVCNKKGIKSLTVCVDETFHAEAEI